MTPTTNVILHHHHDVVSSLLHRPRLSHDLHRPDQFVSDLGLLDPGPMLHAEPGTELHRLLETTPCFLQPKLPSWDTYVKPLTSRDGNNAATNA